MRPRLESRSCFSQDRHECSGRRACLEFLHEGIFGHRRRPCKNPEAISWRPVKSTESQTAHDLLDTQIVTFLSCLTQQESSAGGSHDDWAGQDCLLWRRPDLRSRPWQHSRPSPRSSTASRFSATTRSTTSSCGRTCSGCTKPFASVDPATALAVGLKVDSEALPPELIAALQAGQVDLTDPAVTIALLRLNAVVGVMGKVDDHGQLTSVGITCALCHSTVDNSFTTGIGKRLDGWPNRDLNVGAILGLSPLLDDPGWGPGMYDPRHQVFDGTNIVTRYEDDAAGSDPARIWAEGRRIRDLHRRRTDFLLEQLRRRVADGREGQLQRSPHRALHHPAAGSRHAETACPARVSVRSQRAGSPARQLRCCGSQSRRRSVQRQSGLREVSSCADLHRRVERSRSRRAGASRSRATSAPKRSMRREARPGNTAQRRYAASGSTLRISTMAAPQTCPRSLTTTTM